MKSSRDSRGARSPLIGRVRGLRAKFEDRSIKLGRTDALKRSRQPSAGPPERGKPAKELDPWAEDEPIFGPRGHAHALSRLPGTPPCGNLAVQSPLYPGGDSAAQDLKALFQLAEAVRVELELEPGGRWTCGIVRRASACGLEVALGGGSVDTRDFLQAGRRVRLLVSPRAEPGFVIGARVLWVEPPAEPGLQSGLLRGRPSTVRPVAQSARNGPADKRVVGTRGHNQGAGRKRPGGAVRAQLAVETGDATITGLWEGFVDRARKR